MTDNPMPPGFYNMDCMAAMKQFPDGFFDLAIVDPPYGDGGGSSQVLNVSANGSTATAIRKIGGGCIDHLHSSQRKRERERRQADGTTPSDSGRKTAITRHGGTWAGKFAKKSFRGTSRRGRTTSRNFSVSHVTRSSGAQITFSFRRPETLSYGTSRISANPSQWQAVNMRGSASTGTRRYGGAFRTVRRGDSIRRKSQLRFTNGCFPVSRNRGTRSLIPMSEAHQA